ncbi:unnamed protein product [marine sediment metagenome]|uniref:Uncharacterized protein n=1 Tax=marine sediment metagenome TaxID=412755 RepID=X1C6X2_9ZZZZ
MKTKDQPFILAISSIKGKRYIYAKKLAKTILALAAVPLPACCLGAVFVNLI